MFEDPTMAVILSGNKISLSVRWKFMMAWFQMSSAALLVIPASVESMRDSILTIDGSFVCMRRVIIVLS